MDKDEGRHSGRKLGSGFFFGHEPIAKLYVSKLYKRVTYISSSYTSISTAPEHHSGGLPLGARSHSLFPGALIPGCSAHFAVCHLFSSSLPLASGTPYCLAPLSPGAVPFLPFLLSPAHTYIPLRPPALCSLGGELLTQVQGCLGWCPAFWQAFVNATAASPPLGS